MTPSFSGCYIGHCCYGHTEVGSDVGLVDFSNKTSNRYNLFACKFSVTVNFTFGTAPLGSHVSEVEASGSKEKMIWPDAWWSVTCVANAHSWRDLSVMDDPRRDVRMDATSVSRLTHLPVSEVVTTCRPQPTPIRDSNFFPESAHECRRKSLRGEKLCPIVRPLDQVHFDCVALPEVTGLAGATF